MQASVAIVGIFLCLLIHQSASTSKEEAYSKACHSDLQAGEFIHTYTLENFGCIVDCVIFSSSNGKQQDFFDRSERKRHLLSNIQCLNETYVCLNGSCVINPLKVHPEAVVNPFPGNQASVNSIYRYPTSALIGSANITIHNGYVNRNDHIFSKGDSYVKVFVNQRKVFTSKVQYDTHYPQFGETFFVPSLGRMDIMKFELWDKNGRLSNDDYGGSITTSCDDLINTRLNGKRKAFYVSPGGDEARSTSQHRLYMTIQCRDF